MQLTISKTQQENTMHLTFKQRAEIQARWLMMKNRKTGIDMIELALRFGEALAEKISRKHLILNHKYLKGS